MISSRIAYAAAAASLSATATYYLVTLLAYWEALRRS